MKLNVYRTAAIQVLCVALLPVASAQAQIGDMLKSQTGNGLQSGTDSSSGGLGSLSGLAGGSSLQSLSSGSTGNVAGVLEFCIKNNYLSGDGASSVKDSLMSKLPGGASSSSSDSGYQDGSKGVLDSSSGKQLDLGGGGLKAAATKQVCDKILSQAKSTL